MRPAADVRSKIDYLVPSSRINRRFWAPGKEFNTEIGRASCRERVYVLV